MARKPSKKASNNLGVKKIKLLVVVVNRSKALYYQDLLEQFEITMQMVIYGRGTADSEMLHYLGLAEQDKAILLSCVREDMVKDALETLADKFERIKNGKGIAYTIDIQSIIGVAIYQFLSNNQTSKKEDKKDE